MQEKNAMCGIHSDSPQPRKGSELSGRVMATAWESRKAKAPFVGGGGQRLVVGNRYSWRRRRKRELVRIIILCRSLKLDFLSY